MRDLLVSGYIASERSRAASEIDVVRRALALRKRGRIGVLWADGGQLWISESEFDPHGTRVRLTLDEMTELVESLEDLERKAPAPLSKALAHRATA